MDATLRGKWAKEGGEFVAMVRCGGRGESTVGRRAELASKGKDLTLVTLTELVRDYGDGDVCLFRVSR